MGCGKCPHLLVRRVFRGDKKVLGFSRWLWSAHKRVESANPAAVDLSELHCDICQQPPSRLGMDKLAFDDAAASPPTTRDAMSKRHSAREVAIALRSLVGARGDDDCTIGSSQAIAAALPKLCLNAAAKRSLMAKQRQSCLQAAPFSMSRDDLIVSLHSARMSAVAFGPAYLEGFFSSVPANGALSLPPFHRHVASSTSTLLRAAKVMTFGGAQIEFIDGSSVDQPRTASYIIAIDHSLKSIFVSFRGTMSTGEIVTDLLPRPLAFTPSHLVCGTSPEGFLTAARDGIAKLQSTLLRLEREFCDYQTILTGHSLGGILANVFFYECSASDWERRRVIAFSAAPCVEREVALASRAANRKVGNLTALRERQIINFCYGHDVVPRLQIASLRGLIKPRDLAQQGQTDGLRYYLPGHVVWTMQGAAEGTSEKPFREVDVLAMAEQDAWNTPVVGTVGVQHHFLGYLYRSLYGSLSQRDSI